MSTFPTMQTLTDAATISTVPRWFAVLGKATTSSLGAFVVVAAGGQGGTTSTSDAIQKYSRPHCLSDGFGLEEESLVDLSDLDFEENPKLYLSRAVNKAISRPAARWAITERLFPQLLTKSPAQRRMVHWALCTFAKPDEVVEIALAQYYTFGYEGRLLAAAALLRDMGQKSWPTLRALAKAPIPEVYAFVRVIASMKGIPAADRVQLLVDLARNPDHETRERVLEAWEEHRNLPNADRIREALAESGEDLVQRITVDDLGTDKD